MSKNRVLLVEDSRLEGMITKDVLIKNNYEVKWVLSAEKAMEFNIVEDFDLVLLDVVLPGINGYELCKIIKSVDWMMPVIMLTSRQDDKSLVEALNSGADDYIKKPFSIDELLARIRVQIRTRKLQYELIKKNEELEKANRMIKKLAVTDMLTGAYNRVYIRESLERLFVDSEEDKKNIGYIMIDIDNFKHVNDTYGHLIGDVVLKNVADICKLNINEAGEVVRFGGEEFLVILSSNLSNAFSIAENVRLDCEKSMCCGFKYTISLGVSEYTIRRDMTLMDFECGLKLADEMLYRSKNTGKNKVTINEFRTA